MRLGLRFNSRYPRSVEGFMVSSRRPRRAPASAAFSRRRLIKRLYASPGELQKFSYSRAVKRTKKYNRQKHCKSPENIHVGPETLVLVLKRWLLVFLRSEQNNFCSEKRSIKSEMLTDYRCEIPSDKMKTLVLKTKAPLQLKLLFFPI
ncbi:hypothetical protein EVAR_52174_1 [Eumeta japonica]|uniref:Uncharacterized protein n=1 Tax=Eumeta variegata TaxID=151549 RepID=A0A4C1Y9M2_EUMVA|nr:hypothetical protein EVAR_52174_1 [Eumeta japonica]